MKKCVKCGLIVPDGVNFCTECGTNEFVSFEKTVANEAIKAEDTVAEQGVTLENKTEDAVETVTDEIRSATTTVNGKPINEVDSFLKDSADNTNKPEPVAPVIETEKEEKPLSDKSTRVISTGKFFLFDLLAVIPVIGIISVIVGSAFSKNLNSQHYWKSKLIWLIIGIVLAIIGTVAGFILKDMLITYFGNIANNIQSAIK